MNTIVCLLVGTYLMYVPQSHVSTEPNNEADRVFQEVIAHGIQLEDYRAEFRYHIHSINGRRTQQNGHVLYQKNRYVVQVGDQEIYSDGQTQWRYFPHKQEVYISNYEQGGSNVMELLFQIFYAKISLEYLGEEEMLTVPCEKLKATVLEESGANFEEAFIWVSKDSKMFQKVTFIDQRQNTTNFEFRDFQLNIGLEFSDFQFDLSRHPGVNIIDLRDSNR
ncbi:MAG: outer membrane lipoprotein carrier protein LolA [Bacteroidota bacterium]